MTARHILQVLPLVVFALVIAPRSAVAFFHGDSAEVRNGETLYQRNCASCHGANLEGQVNWRSPGSDGIYPAPPHDKTGHTWHHADRVLLDYITLGGAAALAQSGVSIDSGMPAFGDMLTAGEIDDILAYIKSTWPERERMFQQDRTTADLP